MILDEQAAKVLFGNDDGVGQLVILGTDTAHPYKVVGIARSVRTPQLEAEYAPHVYLATTAVMSGYLLVAGTATPFDIQASLRTTLSRMDPDQAVGAAIPLESVIANSFSADEARARLVVGEATITCATALAGLAGMLVNFIALRQREFGVRFAIGSSERQIQLRIVKEVAIVVCTALPIGGLSAWLLGTLVAKAFVGVQAWGATLFAEIAVGALGASLVIAFAAAKVALQMAPADLLRS